MGVEIMHGTVKCGESCMGLASWTMLNIESKHNPLYYLLTYIFLKKKKKKKKKKRCLASSGTVLNTILGTIWMWFMKYCGS